MKILVTGGSGVVGHYVVDELYKFGHEVVNADSVRMGNLIHSGNTGRVVSKKDTVRLRRGWPSIPKFFQVDIADYGQVISAMDGCEGVISLASRPSAANYTEEDVTRTNVMSMWNVCRAAEQLKISRVVLGSSYNAVGAMGTAARWQPHQTKPPDYFPLDEGTGTRSEDPYSIAKWLGEEIGDAFTRRNDWMSIASMRFNGMWDDRYFSYLHAKPISDVWTRCQGFWTYLHIRDAARACVMAIEAKAWEGHRRLFLNAADTMIAVPTEAALKIVYPDTPMKCKLKDFEAPINCDAAKEVIGWEPLYSWRQEIFAKTDNEKKAPG